MKNFNLSRPTALADALKQLRGAEDGKYLAGGQSLLGAMKLGLAAPSDLIDLSQIPTLRGITLDGGALRIGAFTTHAEVASSPLVTSRLPALAALARGIGDPAVRSRGTLGGSLAHSDPAACYPAAVLALGASIETDRRTLAADGYFKGLYQTALEADEIVVAVRFPLPAAAAYIKFRQPASRYALVGVCVAKTSAGVRVAVTGAGACAFRAPALEKALNARWQPEAVDGIAVSADELNSDMHATAAYRAHLIGVLAKRAVAAAR